MYVKAPTVVPVTVKRLAAVVVRLPSVIVMAAVLNAPSPKITPGALLIAILFTVLEGGISNPEVVAVAAAA